MPKTPAKRTRFLPAAIAIISLLCGAAACARSEKANGQGEEEVESRTEFTDRIENFFEHEPLKAGKESRFLIHLTDLSDGSPVEKADVTLSIRAQESGSEIAKIKTKAGKVTGIYVAGVSIPQPGVYDIEFHVKNDKLDERMPLTGFQVE